MAAAPKVTVAGLMEALLPTIQQSVSEAVAAALADHQPKAETPAPKATSKRRKARKLSELPAFPEGFVKGATFVWTKSTGAESQHRITSIKDGVAHTRSLQGFQGTWKSTTIIAALQSKNCKLQAKPKASKKAA